MKVSQRPEIFAGFLIAAKTKRTKTKRKRGHSNVALLHPFFKISRPDQLNKNCRNVGMAGCRVKMSGASAKASVAPEGENRPCAGSRQGCGMLDWNWLATTYVGQRFLRVEIPRNWHDARLATGLRCNGPSLD